MDKKELNDQQKESLKEMQERGVIFEEFIRSKGWELVQAYYKNKVQNFANGLLLADDRKIDDFEKERREIIGIRKLIGHVDESIREFREYNQKDK